MALLQAKPTTDRIYYNAILKLDLYSFTQMVFGIVSPGEPLQHNWHVAAMTYALERVLKGKIKRLIITVPPRSLKSICASVAFPAFVLGHDPTRRIIGVSYAEGLARKHANDCRAVMRAPFYRRVFPDTRISPSKDTEAEVMTTKRGSRLATSVGGVLTGRGGNLLIIDDPMKPQDAHSKLARESVQQWFSNTLLSRLDRKADDAIILVMQRLHMDDLAGYLLEQGGWIHLNLPAIAECEQRVVIGPGRVHVRKAGDLLHPEREPRETLEALRLSMGSIDFAAQYQQEPVPEGGNLIQWRWFKAYSEPPGWQPGDRIVVSWDTALSGKELANYSACVVLQVRGETAYVLDVIRERLDYPQLRRRVIEVHRRWRSIVANYALLIENKGSGMSLIQDLKGEHIHAVPVDPEGDKVMRMNAQLARIDSGSVWLPTRSPWLADFKQELLAFPAGRNDDQVDAFSQALGRAYQPERRVITGVLLGAC